MPVTCKWVMDTLEKMAPLYLAESWDNSGLLAGDADSPAERVLVALDATAEVIHEAVLKKADMIVTHHPMVFHPVTSIRRQTPIGGKLYTLIQNSICLYAAHTNLDIAFGGTNDVFAEMVGLKNTEVLHPTYTDMQNKVWGIGRIGNLQAPVSLIELGLLLKQKLKLTSIRVFGEQEKKVQRIALCTGSGAEFSALAKEKGAEVYLTGDIKYHVSQEALDQGLCLVDITHFASEVIVVPRLCQYISQEARQQGKTLEVLASSVESDTFFNC